MWQMIDAGDKGAGKRWSVDFAPLSAMAGMEEEEDEVPEVSARPCRPLTSECIRFPLVMVSGTPSL